MGCAISIGFVLWQHVTHTVRWYAGALGVGLFFALSGYLITGVLLDEHDRVGRIDLRRFYRNRLARLMPGLVFMLLVGSGILMATGFDWLLDGALPSALYVMNYASILAGPDHLNFAFGQTWSLAVEEHFYLAWPVVLIAMRRRWDVRRMLYATLGLCAAAIAWRATLIVIVDPRDDFFYFDSLSRADSLLYGCAAALAVRLGWRPRARHLVLGLAGAAVYLDAASPVDGRLLGSAISGAACAGIVVGLDRGLGSSCAIARRLLAVPALAYVGKLSYSIYLWHGVLLAVLFYGTGSDNLVLGLVGVAVCLPIAALSYHVVEAPVRNWNRQRSGPLREGGVVSQPDAA